jgi:hypothetical protein
MTEAEICAACGGNCCKALPGAMYPEQVSDVLELLKTGRYSVDWWEGDPREDEDEHERGYYLRPATKNREGAIMDASWGGECTFLGEHGCELGEDQRPMECLSLIPGMPGKCMHANGVDGSEKKREVACMWLARIDEIESAAKVLQEERSRSHDLWFSSADEP